MTNPSSVIMASLLLVFSLSFWGRAACAGPVTITKNADSSAQPVQRITVKGIRTKSDSSSSDNSVRHTYKDPCRDDSNCSTRLPEPTIQQAAPAVDLNQRFVAQCISPMQKALSTCNSKMSDAQSHCDADNDSGLNKANSDLNSNINAMATLPTQMGAAMGSTRMICSGVSTALSSANLAFQGYQAACSGYRDDCLKTCSDLSASWKKKCSQMRDSLLANVSEAERVKYGTQWSSDISNLDNSFTDSRNSCKSLDSNLRNAQTAMSNLVQTALGAQACNQANSNFQVSICKSNPTLPGCASAAAEDCSNPNFAATNEVCRCQNGSCGTSTAGNGLPNINPFGSGGAPTSNPSSGASPNIDLGLDMSGSGVGGGPSGPGEDVGGNRSSGVNLGSGSSLGDGGNQAAAASAGDDPNSILSGFRGAGYGGGNSFGGGGGDSGGGGSNADSNFNNPARGAGGLGGIDPRQFAPGGQLEAYQKRGLAGVVGPDGITGPHSDIWMKTRSQYVRQQPTLLRP